MYCSFYIYHWIIYQRIWFGNIFCIFASMFMRENHIQFSFLIMPLPSILSQINQEVLPPFLSTGKFQVRLLFLSYIFLIIHLFHSGILYFSRHLFTFVEINLLAKLLILSSHYIFNICMISHIPNIVNLCFVSSLVLPGGQQLLSKGQLLHFLTH